jgi:lipopolysaccharide export system permease protein
MKILTRYLIREIIHYFLVFGAVLVSIMAIYEIYNLRRDFVEFNPRILDVIYYLTFKLPGEFKEVLPLVGLLSTCFAYGLLAKNREILAMVAAGISFLRLTTPVFIMGIILAGVVFVFNEELVPYTDKRAEIIGESVIKKKKSKSVARRKNVFTRGARDQIYSIPYYLPELNTMLYPAIMKLAPGGGRILERLDAERAVMVPENHEHAGLWVFRNLERRIFNPNGKLLYYEFLPDSSLVDLEENLHERLNWNDDMFEMNFSELKTYLELMSGSTDPSLGDLKIKLRQKLVWPIVGLLMTLLGFAVVVDMHARRFARGVSTGLLISIGFYVLNTFLVKLGEKGQIHPVFASWLALWILIAITVFLLLQLNRVRE